LFQSLLARAATDPRLRVHSGASAAEIDQAEDALGVALPPEYREFLERFGHASLGHTHVNGLGGDPSTDVVRCTLEERAALREITGGSAWYEKIVVIAARGNADFHYLRPAEPYRGQVPVLCWDHELDERLIVAMSFAGWLDAILADPHYILPGPIH
jgi:hypothetical protein